MEDKDRAEWVDKDGKPLKFLVVVKLGGIHLGIDYRYRGGDACLCISGKSKQSAFYVNDYIPFLNGAVCCLCRYTFGASMYQQEALKKLGLKIKRKITCIIVDQAMHNDLFMERFNHVDVLLYMYEKFFQAYHVPSGSYYKITPDTKMYSPFLACERLSYVEEYSGISTQDYLRYRGGARAVQVAAYDLSQPAAKYCTVSSDKNTLLKQQKDGRFLMVSEVGASLGAFFLHLDVTNKNYPEELGKPHHKLRLYDVDSLAFLFPVEKQAQFQQITSKHLFIRSTSALP